MIEECPVAPGRRPRPAPGQRQSLPTARQWAFRPPPRRRTRATRTKTARFLALVTEQHGPLAAIPLGSVSRISAAVAPQVDLNAGSARTALRRAVLAAQKGGTR